MTASSTSVVVFTRDLRTRDHPALVAAAAAHHVLPLFVVDDQVLGAHGSPNRTQVLLDCLADLRARLQDLGGDLVVRRGDWVEQVVGAAQGVDASTVHLSGDVSRLAQRRQRELGAALARLGVELSVHEGITVVPPGATAPSGGGEWKVFSPFHRKWLEHPWRPVLDAPSGLALPAGVEPGELPARADLVAGDTSPALAAGGETAALERLKTWAADHLGSYDEHHDDVAGDATSRISADLHLGALSPLEVATRLRPRPGAGPFVRQLCWRDFYHQVLAAVPSSATEDYRDRDDRWRDDPEDLAAWTEGMTGYPLVDAGMRQLLAEGFMHNRTRMVVASFLTKDLYLDWRLGAAHFMRWLADGDVANNQLNWQWTAGTGTDTNPHRIFNPTVQSTRFDPDGRYIRRYVPELADVDAPEIHDPSATTRERTGYPPPIVDHHEAIEAYRAAKRSSQG